MSHPLSTHDEENELPEDIEDRVPTLNDIISEDDSLFTEAEVMDEQNI